MNKYKTVDEFLDDLEADKKSQVLKLREYILDTQPELNEHIKWNAPSYTEGGNDRITFNLFNKEGLVKLVFHMGVSRKEDKKGKPILDDKFLVMEWASDIRGYITFMNLEDVIRKEKAVKQLTSEWLTIN